MPRRTPSLLASLALLACTAGCDLDEPTTGVRVVVEEGRAVAAGEGAGRAGGDLGTRVERRTLEGLPVERPETVAVVGDSLTASATAEITAALDAIGLDVVAIDGLESRRMVDGGSSHPPGVEAISDISAFGQPDLWIVALGTNDVGAQVRPDDFRADARSVLQLIPAGVPVLWVDLYIRDRAPDVAAANDALRAAVDGRPGSMVADWHAAGDDDGVIAGDGVHLTELGRQRFAATMAAGVEALFPG